jgi:hypothetical protein
VAVSDDIDSLRATVARLERERSEAIRYMSTDQIEYGKLVADLCKQRDTALRERDEARAECERMRMVYEAAIAATNRIKLNERVAPAWRRETMYSAIADLTRAIDHALTAESKEDK